MQKPYKNDSKLLSKSRQIEKNKTSSKNETIIEEEKEKVNEAKVNKLTNAEILDLIDQE